MDEVIPNLWIGDLASSLNVELLKENKIYSILSAMRGRVTLHDAFIRHQINIDDTDEEDVLVHFLPSIAFIQAELDKGRGVLVHCQAGMSRSATIVAAYLMYSRQIDCETALELIRKARPSIQPNDGFMLQLQIFHQAAFQISPRDKTTRMFYLERTLGEVMNGDGTISGTEMFAKFPRTPTESTPPTPGAPRRRIRCKMCRQELATREHMLDHGQLGPPTPAVAFSPASSRRPSTNEQLQPANRRPSINVTVSRRPSFGQPRPRVGSHGENRPPISFANLGRRLSDSLAMSALDTEDDHTDSAHVQPHRSRVNIGRGLSDSLSMSALSMSALDTDEEDAHHVDPTPVQRRSRANIGRGLSDTLSMSALDSDDDDERHIDSIHVQPRSRLSSIGDNRPIRPSPLHENSNAAPVNNEKSSQPATGSVAAVPAHPQPPTSLASPAELAAQLHAHPKLASLRTSLAQGQPLISPISPPILVNSKCSGYFVEPMKWMESFLEGGQLAGKIICPNKKCGAKLGNYDWAGVCCGCKEWVTPGFCINRSKVDEVV